MWCRAARDIAAIGASGGTGTVVVGATVVVVAATVVVVAGTPPGIPGSTNSLRVHKVGDAKNGVVPAYNRG